MFRITISAFLLLFISLFASAQKDSATLQKLNFGHEGYFKTYEDFLKGNVVEGEFKSAKLVAGKYVVKFKIAGKINVLNVEEIWGFWSKQGLVRINHKDSIGYKLISAGDVFYYCSSFAYPVMNSKTGKVEYAESEHADEMISVNLNSEMLGQLDLYYSGVARATAAIAGNPDIYKFELCGHGAFEKTDKGKQLAAADGGYIGSCYLAKSNPHIWLNPVGDGVAYVEEPNK